MPGKACKRRSDDEVRGGNDTSELLSLPAPVLATIAEFGLRRWRRGQPGHSLLGVSQACRDAVLHATTSISMLGGHPSSAPSAAQTSADARLLHRACCEASPGLEVSLHMRGWDPDTLSVLLQPGASSRGWTKVQNLRVRAVLCLARVSWLHTA
jgi:hypothetical protein